MLVAIFASDATAETRYMNPGSPGEDAQDLSLGLIQGGEPLVVLWTDNKTLTWEAGTQTWLTPGAPFGVYYGGFLLGLDLLPIPNTYFEGHTPFDREPIPLGTIELTEKTVFRGLYIAVDGNGVDMNWEWNEPKPLVGVHVVPVEATSWGRIKQLYGN